MWTLERGTLKPGTSFLDIPPSKTLYPGDNKMSLPNHMRTQMSWEKKIRPRCQCSWTLIPGNFCLEDFWNVGHLLLSHSVSKIFHPHVKLAEWNYQQLLWITAAHIKASQYFFFFSLSDIITHICQRIKPLFSKYYGVLFLSAAYCMKTSLLLFPDSGHLHSLQQTWPCVLKQPANK